MTEEHEYIRGYNDGYADGRDHQRASRRSLLDGPTNPTPVVGPDPEQKTTRLDLLTKALVKAEAEAPKEFRRVNAFRQALIDVRLDAVMERTHDAMNAAAVYLKITAKK